MIHDKIKLYTMDKLIIQLWASSATSAKTTIAHLGSSVIGIP